MSSVRRDIEEAEARMRVTFGTRTAIRNLHESLEPGELVQEMVACLYAGSDGLLVLTDQRVLAVRDDYSRFRFQSVAIAEAAAVDYAPTIHDGLAVLTDDGRVAVRKMNREDSDRLVAALIDRKPGIIIGASRPRVAGLGPGHADETSPPRSAPARTPARPPAPSPKPSPKRPAPEPVSTDDPPPPAKPPPVPSRVGTSYPARKAAPVQDEVAESAEADRDVLLGVLADLHAKGILSAAELAEKIAQVAAKK